MGPIATYDAVALLPLYDGVRTLDVVLPGGTTYPKGQVIGQVAGTGTAVNDVQTITITGTPTGGSFNLFFGGVLIGTIAYNATAAQVKTLLEAFFGVGPVTTSGGPFPGTPVVVTFQNEAGGRNQVVFTTTAAFTGGASPAVAVAHTTPGKPAGGYFDAYVDTVVDPAKAVLKYPIVTDPLGNVVFGSGMAGVIGNALEAPPRRGAPAYFSGSFKVSDLTGLDAAGLADLGKLLHGNAITDANAIISILTGAA